MQRLWGRTATLRRENQILLERVSKLEAELARERQCCLETRAKLYSICGSHGYLAERFSNYGQAVVSDAAYLKEMLEAMDDRQSPQKTDKEDGMDDDTHQTCRGISQISAFE